MTKGIVTSKKVITPSLTDVTYFCTLRQILLLVGMKYPVDTFENIVFVLVGRYKFPQDKGCSLWRRICTCPLDI